MEYITTNHLRQGRVVYHDANRSLADPHHRRIILNVSLVHSIHDARVQKICDQINPHCFIHFLSVYIDAARCVFHIFMRWVFDLMALKLIQINRVAQEVKSLRHGHIGEQPHADTVHAHAAYSDVFICAHGDPQACIFFYT